MRIYFHNENTLYYNLSILKHTYIISDKVASDACHNICKFNYVHKKFSKSALVFYYVCNIFLSASVNR